MRIDQIVPHVSPHDAIGNHVFEVRRALRTAGYQSDIYGEHIAPSLAGEVRPFATCPERADDRILIYQASTDTDVLPWLLDRAAEGQTLWSNYHNVTPGEFFERYEPAIAAKLRLARRQIAELAPFTSLALADSAFNGEELRALGYPRVEVAPILIDLDEFRQAPHAALLARLERQAANGGHHWLFVGRVAPHKCQHDIMTAFAVYRRLTDPQARLTLVGGESSAGYGGELRVLAAELEIEDALEVRAGIDLSQLLAYYATADVFVCQSEHEGFCVPALESMTLGVPVVAHAAAALPDTVGDGAVLLDDKDPLACALAVGDLLADAPRREELVRRARRRAADFALPVTRRIWQDAIDGWVAASETVGDPIGVEQEVR